MSIDIQPQSIVGMAFGAIQLLILAGYGISRAASKIDEGLERRAARKTIQGLIAQPITSYKQEWRLPAPESYALFIGIENIRDQPFKAAILQLLAERVLTLEVFIEVNDNTKKYSNIGEAVLRRGPSSADRLEGSLGAIYRLWESQQTGTIRSLALQARQKYGSLADFTEMEVKPRLVEAGVYTREECRYPTGGQTAGYATAAQADKSWFAAETRMVTSYALTPKGQAMWDELRSRMAAVLRGISQERSAWIDEKPLQALLGAVVAVAAGKRKTAEETEMDLITREVGSEAPPMAVTLETDAPDYYRPVWIDWAIFDNLDRTYAAVDTGCDASEQGGDGGDGGGSDGGGSDGGSGDSGGGGGD